MKLVANGISIVRIVLSGLLFFLTPLDGFFIVVYAIAGLSDMLDGFVARKTKTTSKLGEKLDSIGDAVLVAAVLYKLIPLIEFGWLLLLLIGLVTAIRVTSMLVVFMKYQTFAILHTYANKVTGFLLFLFPFFFIFLESMRSLYFIAGFALISALEELVIHLKAETLDVNQKSVFTLT